MMQLIPSNKARITQITQITAVIAELRTLNAYIYQADIKVYVSF